MTSSSPTARPASLWASRRRAVARSVPAAAYLAASIAVTTVLFVLVVTSVALAASLVVVGIGVPMLLVAAALVRAAAHVERQRAAMVPGVDAVEPPQHGDRPRLTGARVGGGRTAGPHVAGSAEEPRPAAGRGLLAAVRRDWGDPAMAPSLGYLVGLYVPLLALDAIALSVWLSFLGGVTVPLWYSAVPHTFDGVTHHGLFWGWFPNGPGGSGAVGLAVDDLPSAFAFAGVSAALFVLVGCPLVIAAARLHTRIVARLLGPPVDPLAAARAVLRSSGPLTLDRQTAMARPTPAPSAAGGPHGPHGPLALVVPTRTARS